MIKFFPYIRSSANFRSRKAGDYNNTDTWEVQGSDGTWYGSPTTPQPYYPQSGNVITIAHTVALTQDEYCYDFTVTTGSITYNGHVLNTYEPPIEAPVLVSATVEEANPDLLLLEFDEAVTITITGWSIASDGDAISISSVQSGSNTDSPVFQLSRGLVGGEDVTISYNSSTGSTVSTTTSIELESIVNRNVDNEVPNLVGDLYVTQFDSADGAIVSVDAANYASGKTGANAAFNVASSQLAVSGGINTITEYLRRTSYLTNLHSWHREANIIIGSINGTSYGIGIGIQSNRTSSGSTANFSYCAVLRLDTGNVGKIDWHFMNNATPVQTYTTPHTIAPGANVKIEFFREQLDLKLKVTNVDTAEEWENTYSTVVDFSGNPPPNGGFFTIFAIGGSVTFVDDKADSLTPKDQESLWLGDSTMAASGASDVEHGYVYLFTQQIGWTYVNNAGPGNRTDDINVDEAVNLNPDRVFICFGLNDIANGKSNSQTYDDIVAMGDEFEDLGYEYGVNLFFISITPSSVVNFIGLTKLLLDTHGPLNGSGPDAILTGPSVYLQNKNDTQILPAFDYGDGVHENNAGNKVIADQLYIKFSGVYGTIYHLSEFWDVDATEGTAYTPQIGTAWGDSVYHALSDSEIINKELHLDGFGADTLGVAYTDIGVQDCVLRFYMRNAGGVFAFPAWRVTDYDNKVALYLDSATPANNSFYKNGVTAIGTVDDFVIPDDSLYTIEITLVGTSCSMRVLIDGTVIGTGSCTMDSGHTGTLAGIQSQGVGGRLRQLIASSL